MESQNHFTIFIRNWLVAASSVAIAKTFTAPLERVKIIVQTQPLSPHFTEMEITPYTGVWNALVRICREQGVLSLWRGNVINMVRHLPSSAFSFAFNDFFKAHLIKDEAHESSPSNRLFRHMLCGGLAGFATITIVQPLALCQTLITSDIGRVSSERRFSGAMDCFKQVYAEGGIRAFYTGYTVGILGVTAYRSVYFGLYSSLKEKFETTHGERASFLVAWATAQVVTLVAGGIAYPLDTISRGQQIVSLSSREGYKIVNPIETARIITRKKGIRALYKGLWVSVIRSVGGALVMVAYDEIQYRFFTKEERKSILKNKRIESFLAHGHHGIEDTRRTYRKRHD